MGTYNVNHTGEKMTERPLPELQAVLAIIKNANRKAKNGEITERERLEAHERAAPGYLTVRMLARKHQQQPDKEIQR